MNKYIDIIKTYFYRNFSINKAAILIFELCEILCNVWKKSNIIVSFFCESKLKNCFVNFVINIINNYISVRLTK